MNLKKTHHRKRGFKYNSKPYMQTISVSGRPNLEGNQEQQETGFQGMKNVAFTWSILSGQ